MNILRGMLRTATIAAVLVAIGGVVASHFDVTKEQDRLTKSWEEDTRIWKGLRCGGRFLDKDMTAYTNEYGLIDIGRAGCSDKSLFARFDEIRDAMAAAAPPKPDASYWATYFPHLGLWLTLALIAFCFVNLLGLMILIVRSATRWIRAGFQ